MHSVGPSFLCSSPPSRAPVPMKSLPVFCLAAAFSAASAAPVPWLHVDAAAQRELRNKLSLPPLAVNQPADIVLGTRGSEIVALKST